MRLTATMSLCLGSAIFVVGCSDSSPYEPPRSDEFSPSEIRISAEVRTNGSVAQIQAAISVESTPIVLGATDTLSFGAPGELVQKLSANQSAYVGQVETNATELDLFFNRGKTQYASKLLTPPPFTITPNAGTASRSAPIPISWDIAEGTHQMRVEIAAQCLLSPIWRNFSEDLGAYEIQPADLAIEPGTSDCDFSVWVTRFAPNGEISATLAPSPIPLGSQVRVLTIATIP